ncbi:spore germination protein [Alicyclobacillus sp.]|uniref:spore germination protein n=1 Tax=Alicyclobacillus sp. TaxID=61169 RepID=UPI0025C4A7B5|nr:spore germination protein [Alicyclobacillus sp.]MCL6516764.1 spore germination protein [Alicyclobacillus sp.]
MKGRRIEGIPSRLSARLCDVETRLCPCPDLRRQVLDAGANPVVLLWMDGLVDGVRLQNAVETWRCARSATRGRRTAGASTGGMAIPGVDTRVLADTDEVLTALSDGCAVCLTDKRPWAVAWDVSRRPGRAVDKPENEPTLQGPQEAFVESLSENFALLRKRLRRGGLRMEGMQVGTRAPVRVGVMYVEGIARPELVGEVRRRIRNIRTDTAIDLNVIREYVTDAPFSLFPTTEETERPERVAASLLQGRVGVMVDGAPNCMLVPVTFMMFLGSPEDYYMHFTMALPLRLLRHLMFWAAVLLPSLYVALLTYNQDLVPTPLLVSVAAQHAGIPFPTMVEALGMMIAFEALREAGTRLPRAVGQSVSIVGTLIIGDAAVRAGLVSPGMVIVVAATGVASFTLPALGLVQATRILQFPFVVMAAVFGLYGVVLLGLVVVGHMASLRSFGVPYLSPVAPHVGADMKDVVIRAPWWAMRRRPRQFQTQDDTRANGRPLGRRVPW